ncbi:MAG: hypothetical protein EAY76_05990 [Alphaproteobacteria bacterium]|nr:MAG: hypothetical protein EAY76_05990 [Alphaproteobacteria bacterium]TAF77161.1 MAG: hypothetical protein EAZ52_01095 [Alphaproteobacteria bacterium]
MPEISRISTMSIHSRAVENFNRTQTRLAGFQDQLSSGFKGRTFKAYDGDVQEIVSLNREVNKLQTFLENNTETVSRLKTQEKALEKMQTIGDEVKKLLVLRNNPTVANNMEFVTQMKNLREAFGRELNTDLEGRFLFAGTRTDMPPIVDPIPESLKAGDVDIAYYQGSKENVIARIQDNIEIEYSTRADDPAFQKFFAAVSYAITAHPVPGANDSLKKSQSMLDEAIAGINSLTASVRSKYTDIENINKRNEDLRDYYQGVGESLVRADPIEVTTRVAMEETTLQATFQIFARISALKLSDFLG